MEVGTGTVGREAGQVASWAAAVKAARAAATVAMVEVRGAVARAAVREVLEPLVAGRGVLEKMAARGVA